MDYSEDDDSDDGDDSDLEESETEQEKDNMLGRIYPRSIDDYDSEGICVNITSFHNLRATPVIR